MPATLLRARTANLADALKNVGNVSPERIGLPVGTATESNVIEALEAAHKRMFELIDGVLVEKTMGFEESVLALEIGAYIRSFVKEHDLGLTFSADGPFRIRPGRVRMPDTGFISWERLPDETLPHAPILDASPNLAVEVISTSNTATEMKLKLKDYFGADVELCWFIYPKTQTAEVYTSLRSKKTIDKDGTLDGGNVLPGFRLPLKKLFECTRKKKRN